MSGLHDVLNRLNLNSSNGLYHFHEQWDNQVNFPSRIKQLLEKKIKPTAFFCFDNKPLILFFENPKNKNELHRMIWNFNECPIIIIIEENAVEVFNGFKLSFEKNGFLNKIGDHEKLDDFNYFKLVTGQTWEKYQKELHYENRVDYMLLSNIRETRKLIIEKFPDPENKEIEKKHTKITNALLGKIIFIRYLIDKGVKLNFEDTPKIWTNGDLCNLLMNHKRTRQFFDYLSDPDKGFNGDLFVLTVKEYAAIPQEAYKEIIRLLKSEDIGTGQRSLFDLYDFSIIPIEFISNIYESFVGIENQAKEGVYYTPLFLVDYILSETITKAVECNKNTNCKLLDPACGSGVFLVEALRKLIEQYIADNANKHFKADKFKKDIKKIAEDNIFGIDKDESAIQVAIFSVYLTFLDYMNPPEIATFKFPNLRDTNFFCDNFFDTEAAFNTILKDKEFLFIVGNPPWRRGNDEEKPLYTEYIRIRKNKEKDKGEPFIDIGNKEIAQAFLLRSSDFSNENTKCALIVTSKALYNLQSNDFRKYFLQHYLIEQVFELAPVRREVFNRSNTKAISPACVLFFRYAHGENTDSNIIKHIALKPSRFFFLFKIFAVSRYDIQSVQQNRLKQDDWMWKVLVYGSYFDFNFIKRLKDEFDSIQNILDKETDTLVSQGIKRVDGEEKINADRLLGLDFLDLKKKEIEQFYLPLNHHKWELPEVGYIYRENGEICEDVFSPPMLLVKETVNTNLESVSAVSFQKILFTDKVTSIKFRNNKNIDNYYLLAGLMNSTLFAYYMLHKSSTAGIMIEQQINDKERFSFPYSYSKDIINYAKKIESLKRETNSALFENNQNDIDKMKENIDFSIFKLFQLNDIEQTLVDYSKNVMIPILMKHKGYDNLFLPCEFKDKILQDYANLFLNRFEKRFESVDKKLIAEVWYTNQVIGIFFRVVIRPEYKETILWENKQIDETGILQRIIELGVEKITEQLFVQKDVRGFEEEYFYIFKPNEKRLWHKAIGYLDIEEFADAMHQVKRENDYEQ
ncbi:type I endonuclease-methyltransferase fusion protein [Spirochaetia bacterium]|nr:type I endonuclease-methyltransferase fusion protein [Spirochaetia bacterium]